MLSTADAIQKVDVLNVEICRVATVLGRILQKTGFKRMHIGRPHISPTKLAYCLGRTWWLFLLQDC